MARSHYAVVGPACASEGQQRTVPDPHAYPPLTSVPHRCTTKPHLERNSPRVCKGPGGNNQLLILSSSFPRSCLSFRESDAPRGALSCPESSEDQDVDLPHFSLSLPPPSPYPSPKAPTPLSKSPLKRRQRPQRSSPRRRPRPC